MRHARQYERWAHLVTEKLVPPPPPPRTKWTRRVPHPVLIGHAVCLVQVASGGLAMDFRNLTRAAARHRRGPAQ